MDKLKVTTKYTGRYEGIAFDIQQTEGFNGFENNWVYYLYLPLTAFPKGHRLWLKHKESSCGCYYDYLKHELLNDIFSNSGGITYYEKVRGLVRGEPKVIKVGCDFMHSWDEGMNYDLEDIHSKAKEAIEMLRCRVPKLKWRCCWDGKYYKKKDGFINSSGTFTSNKAEEIRKARKDTT